MEDRRSDAVVDAGSSIVEHERWLQTAAPAILDELAAYSRTDCLSTSKLRDWLEERRGEYAGMFGAEAPRPRGRDGPVGATARLPRASKRKRPPPTSSTGRSPRSVSRDTAEGRGRQLLCDLLPWHRREDKPAWWQYFKRSTSTRKRTSSTTPSASAGSCTKALPAPSAGRWSITTGSPPRRSTSSTWATSRSTPGPSGPSGVARHGPAPAPSIGSSRVKASSSSSGDPRPRPCTRGRASRPVPHPHTRTAGGAPAAGRGGGGIRHRRPGPLPRRP